MLQPTPGDSTWLPERASTRSWLLMPLFVAPVFLREGYTVEGLLVGKPRCGAPTLFASYGHVPDGSQRWSVGMEWPEPYRQRTDKGEKEAQHLGRFIADYRSSLGVSPYDSPQVGDDPPDFVAVRGGSSVAVECTQLLLRERVEASAQFRRVRLAVQGVNRHRFRRLTGHVIYVAFDHPSRPPKNTTGNRALIAALGSYTPVDTTSVTSLDAGIPDGLIQKFEGGQLIAAPLDSPPAGSLYVTHGFELALAYSTDVEPASLFAEMQRLVSDHDSPPSTS